MAHASQIGRSASQVVLSEGSIGQSELRTSDNLLSWQAMLGFVTTHRGFEIVFNYYFSHRANSTRTTD
eukprot:scaffold671766_cov59-Prasinocladus_malaysianus.AAC.1